MLGAVVMAVGRLLRRSSGASQQKCRGAVMARMGRGLGRGLHATLPALLLVFLYLLVLQRGLFFSFSFFVSLFCIVLPFCF